MSINTSVQFIQSVSNEANWKLLHSVISSMSIWELWFFGVIQKPKNKPLSYQQSSCVGSKVTFEKLSLDPSGFAQSDWVNVKMKQLGGPLKKANFYAVARAVNAALMFRECKGVDTIISTEFMAALKQGGYWDSTTPIQVKMMLDFWGHKISDVADSAPNWFSENEPPKGWEGKFWLETDILDMLWLPEAAPYLDFLKAHATQTNDEHILLYDTLWVKYTNEHIFFPSSNREGRFRYTWKGEGPLGGETRWVKGDSHMLGNVLFWWCISEPSEKWISALINKEATNLVAPNRVYGHPSPLNKASDRYTVGHLTLRLDGGGNYPICLEVDNDEGAYAAADAAKYAFEEGLPVLFQHQLESLRVGKAASGLGKSSIKMILPIKGPDGSMKQVKVRLSLGQIAVDRSTKLFNRDSLEFRCQPIVEAHRADISDEQVKEESSLVDSFDSFANDLLK